MRNLIQSVSGIGAGLSLTFVAIGLFGLVACGRSGLTAEETVAFLTTGAEDGAFVGGFHKEDRYTQTGASPAIFEFTNPRLNQKIRYKVEKVSACVYRTQYLDVRDGEEVINNQLELDFSSVSAVKTTLYTTRFSGLKKRCIPVPCESVFGAEDVPAGFRDQQDRLNKALTYLHDTFCPMAPF